MKKKTSIFESFHISRSKVEPHISQNMVYPLSHIPLVLLLQDGECAAMAERKLLHKGCKDLQFFSIIHGFYGRIPQGKLKEIINMPSIRYITYNHRVHPFMQDYMEGMGNQYHIHHYDVSGRGVVVAHLDTGIHPHGDFMRPRGRLVAFQDFINHRDSPYDDHGHGTLCAGCIAGNGLTSKGKYRGLASDCHLIALKCLDQGGIGDMRSVLSALQWVHENQERYHIRLVHIPFGVHHSYPLMVMVDPLVMAVERLWEEGLIVVCAAGNYGPDKATIASPGTSTKVITVGSSTFHATPNVSSSICPFSGRGPTLDGNQKPDIVAPGMNIPSTCHEILGEPGGYLSFSGTSASSAIVVGAVALLLEKHPNLTPSEVKLALDLSSSSLHLEKNAQGKGVLNIQDLMHLDLKNEESGMAELI